MHVIIDTELQMGIHLFGDFSQERFIDDVEIVVDLSMR